MNIFSYILALFTSVGAMTMFSLIMSVISNCEFRENILLSKLMSGHSLNEKESLKYVILGWLAHFFLGGFFLVIYTYLWYNTALLQHALGSILFGIIIGILGILGWTMLFKMASNPPQINYKIYYMQLIVAHIHFSLGNFLIFSLLG
ncbi:hypothetical protein [Cellulophaga baltica]|uniref:Uncharacterized protein n=1 Tax=Cellulophaga baltica TaxID=76594 RepID=A0A1G7LNJ6_9FLAO|nr:hypothetical protein [Cellulophaga baltica]SDF51098.1 hypothetical protein SAMN04487992_1202 [Cellulophaga baltica]